MHFARIAALFGVAAAAHGAINEKSAAPTTEFKPVALAKNDHKKPHPQKRKLEVDGGWQVFYFDAEGKIPAYFFLDCTDSDVIVTITDAFCAGDMFAMYIDYRFALKTSYVDDCNCQHEEEDPWKAYRSPYFSHSQVQLLSPTYTNISIVATNAPYGKGAGYIRADRILQRCPLYTPPFTIPLGAPRSWWNARDLCQRIDSELAEVGLTTNANAAFAVTNCLAPGAQAWIGGSIPTAVKGHQDPELALCPVFTATSETEGVIEYISCNNVLPVMCWASTIHPMMALH